MQRNAFNRGVYRSQTIGKFWNEYWSSLFLVICKGKIKLTPLLSIWKIIPNDVLHLFREYLEVSHQVHGNNISGREQKKKSIILPQYLISHRVITISEGGNFSNERRRKLLEQDSLFITAMQDVGPSVGFDVKQKSPQRHRK